MLINNDALEATFGRRSCYLTAPLFPLILMCSMSHEMETR